MKMEKSKFITCILSPSKTMDLVKKLYHEKGITTTIFHTARGSSYISGIANEKDIITVIIPEEQSDDIFEFIYKEAAIAEERGSFMFQGDLLGATPYILSGKISEKN